MTMWTTEEMAFLRDRSKEGLSGREIAKMMSAKFNRLISRNSVIGVRNRRGWNFKKPALPPRRFNDK